MTVAGEGGLRALVALSRCEDLELRILAAGALRHLSLNTRVKRPMVEEGALGSILRALSRKRGAVLVWLRCDPTSIFKLTVGGPHQLLPVKVPGCVGSIASTRWST